MADITQEVNIDMLEKLADGNYKIKYPKTKAEQVVYGDGSTAVYHSSYAVASGTNSYTVNIPGITSLIEGMSVKVKFTSANTGACTLNINGLGAKEIRKSNGNALSSGNIKAGQICHLVYTGSVFQLLGEGGEYGTAQPNHVLEGITFGTEDGLKVGTMPNRGGVNRTLTTQGGTYTIPEGYHDGTGKVKAQFANLTASNIKKGVTIGGVTGTLKTLDLSNYSGLVRRITLSGGESVTETFSSEYSLIIALLMPETIDLSKANPYTMTVRFNNKNLSVGPSDTNWITINSLTNSSITLRNITSDRRTVILDITLVN